jgi:CheY-like chemotaxis protein
MRPPRILLVDDYPDALTTWAFFLKTRGYAIDTARDGAAAIRLATADTPDLIVMDLVLPVLDGCGVARRLRLTPTTAGIPIIATTGDVSPAHLDEARSIGFFRIMIKPCDPPRLLEQIERALSEKLHVRAAIGVTHGADLRRRAG